MAPTMAAPLPALTGTSIAGSTTQPAGVAPTGSVNPGVEKNLSPHWMLAGELARTTCMAWIMVAQRSAQVPVLGSQGLSSAMALVMVPERSSTSSRSAGSWAILLALLPQLASKVGAG